jgi:hypothetical protein
MGGKCPAIAPSMVAALDRFFTLKSDVSLTEGIVTTSKLVFNAFYLKVFDIFRFMRFDITA